MTTTVKGDEVIGFAAAIIEDELSKKGIAQGVAQSASLAVSSALMTSFGGQLAYFPKDSVKAADSQALEILEDFEHNKLGIAELVKKYKLSTPTIYKKISRARLLKKEQRTRGND